MNSPTPTPVYLFFDLTHPTLLVLCTQTLLLQKDNRHISYLSCPVLTPTCLDDCPCEQWRCGVCIVLDMAILVATPDLARGIMAALDYSDYTLRTNEGYSGKVGIVGLWCVPDWPIQMRNFLSQSISTWWEH